MNEGYDKVTSKPKKFSDLGNTSEALDISHNPSNP